jgi:NAD+ kinase
MARHAGVYLQQRGVVVKVEERVRDDDLPEFEALSEDQLSGDVASEIDFVLCLGGDGTLLHLSSLLTGNGENAVPPVVSFGLGSLGFLTPFDIRDIEHCLDRLLDTENQELFCSIRTFRVRLREHIKFILLHEEDNNNNNNNRYTTSLSTLFGRRCKGAQLCNNITFYFHKEFLTRTLSRKFS